MNCACNQHLFTEGYLDGPQFFQKAEMTNRAAVNIHTKTLCVCDSTFKFSGQLFHFLKYTALIKEDPLGSVRDLLRPMCVPTFSELEMFIQAAGLVLNHMSLTCLSGSTVSCAWSHPPTWLPFLLGCICFNFV